MTETQSKRIHDIIYSNNSREELGERIVALEDENAELRELAKAAWGCVKRQVSCDECRIVACGCTLATAMREYGIEVDE